MRGTVKWFKDDKGFGFISTEDKNIGDVFVHHTGIDMPGFKTLKSGQQVEFDVVKEPRGNKAENVRVV